MSYSKYRGRSVGRILHGLNVYCDSFHRFHELCQVGDGQVFFHETKIARYEWNSKDENSDVPHFYFYENKYVDSSLSERFTRNQFLKAPFIDEHSVVHSDIYYIVQELRKLLTIDEALALLHIRDKLDGKWEDIHWSGLQIVEQKIKKFIDTHFLNRWDSEKTEKHWKHFAMCTVWELQQNQGK